MKGTNGVEENVRKRADEGGKEEGKERETREREGEG